MSIQGSAGAESAASEIAAFVEKKIGEHRDQPEVVKVLQEVLTKAREIASSAAEGWY